MSTSAEATAPSVDQPPPVAQARYGGFWVRFVAILVDGLIIQLVWAVAAISVYLVQGGLSEGAEKQLSVALGVFMLLYDGYFLSSERMATPGKRLFGLYVTDIGGQRLNFVQAVLRRLAYILSFLPLCIGFVMIAFSARKQGLHDRIVGTLVHRRSDSSAVASIAMIFVFVVVFLVVSVAGIWHAVGKSAVFDYGARLGMEELYKLMVANKVPVQNYAKKNNAWPTTWAQVESAGGKHPKSGMESVTQHFVKDVQMEEYGAMVATIEIADKTGKLRVAPQRVENQLGWTCVASAEIVKYVPEACGVMK